MILTTERLVLRPLTIEDTDSVHAYMSDPEVCRYTFSGPYAPEETAAFVRKICDQADGHEEFAVIERETGEIIGHIRCEPYGKGRAEVGWFLRRDRWRRGYGTESARAIIAYAASLPGVIEIVARCDQRNAASVAIVKGLGMTLVGVIKDDERNGTVRDSLLFAIPAETTAPNPVTSPGLGP